MTMSLVTSMLTALFMMCIVFFVLAALWFILRILGGIFLSREKANTAPENNAQTAQKV